MSQLRDDLQAVHDRIAAEGLGQCLTTGDGFGGCLWCHVDEVTNNDRRRFHAIFDALPDEIMPEGDTAAVLAMLAQTIAANQ